MKVNLLISEFCHTQQKIVYYLSSNTQSWIQGAFVVMVNRHGSTSKLFFTSHDTSRQQAELRHVTPHE